MVGIAIPIIVIIWLLRIGVSEEEAKEEEKVWKEIFKILGGMTTPQEKQRAKEIIATPGTSVTEIRDLLLVEVKTGKTPGFSNLDRVQRPCLPKQYLEDLRFTIDYLHQHREKIHSIEDARWLRVAAWYRLASQRKVGYGTIRSNILRNFLGISSKAFDLKVFKYLTSRTPENIWLMMDYEN